MGVVWLYRYSLHIGMHWHMATFFNYYSMIFYTSWFTYILKKMVGMILAQCLAQSYQALQITAKNLFCCLYCFGMWIGNMHTEGSRPHWLYKGTMQQMLKAQLPPVLPGTYVTGMWLCSGEENGRSIAFLSRPLSSQVTVHKAGRLGWIIILGTDTEPFVCGNQSAWLMLTC